MEFPREYLKKAFEFDRVFFYKWSVNWQFLGEEWAVSKNLALFLLASHIILLLYFCFSKWVRITHIFGEIGLWPINLRFNRRILNP